ncbi:MarR family winged helix-turn-helix transcriptional regulator [Niveispirillum sp. KHB5.9]|uniref:MarR family winged helix-turn-helix transcriptional regulator n=1 Tax=Niveispirillum sp. KHB5.9 TaxID=3400269 RepID=UPI003A8945F7
MTQRYALEHPITRENAPLNFLKLFYPYHYAVGMAVEKHLASGVLDRHQTVILWLIHSKGEGGTSLPRKVIEQLIGEWYDLGSPAITKALRKLAQPPLDLISIDESKASGREKIISLTPAGQEFVARMVASGADFIAQIVDHLSDAQIHAGMSFMARVSEVVEVDIQAPRGER